MAHTRKIDAWPRSYIQYRSSEQALQLVYHTASLHSLHDICAATQLTPERIVTALTCALYIDGCTLQDIVAAMHAWGGTAYTCLVEETITALQSHWWVSDYLAIPSLWEEAVHDLNRMLQAFHKPRTAPTYEMPFAYALAA